MRREPRPGGLRCIASRPWLLRRQNFCNLSRRWLDETGFPLVLSKTWQERDSRLPISRAHPSTDSLNASETTLRPEVPRGSRSQPPSCSRRCFRCRWLCAQAISNMPWMRFPFHRLLLTATVTAAAGTEAVATIVEGTAAVAAAAAAAEIAIAAPEGAETAPAVLEAAAAAMAVAVAAEIAMAVEITIVVPGAEVAASAETTVAPGIAIMAPVVDIATPVMEAAARFRTAMAGPPRWGCRNPN